MRVPAVCAVAVVLAIAGCSGDDDANSGERPSAAAPTVTVPPSRLTPFCQAMIDLADRLETDESTDAGELILETYLSIVDEVPDEIEEDFLVVVARLQRDELPDLATTSPSTSPSTTTTSRSGEPTGDDEPTAGEATTDPGPSTLDDAEYQGWTPDDDPALRVNGYVDFVCRDNLNNPGPPATVPPPPELDTLDDTPEDTPEETVLDDTQPATVEPTIEPTIEPTAGASVDPAG